MAKKDNIWVYILGALAVVGFIWAYSERNKRKLLEEENKNIKKDYLQLLAQYVEQNHGISNEIKEQILNLRNRFVGIEDKYAIELHRIVGLLEIGNEEVAIEKLTKVIENILKDKYIENGIAKDRKSCPKLFKMLEKSLELKWIDKHQYNFSFLLKENRNEEAHEIAVKFPKNWKIISFLSGIEIIYTLKGFKA